VLSSNRGGYDRVGVPINDIHGWGNGQVQDFRQGSNGEGIVMQRNGSNEAYYTSGDIWRVYRDNGGPDDLAIPPATPLMMGMAIRLKALKERITRRPNGDTFIGSYVNGHLLPDDFFRVWREYDSVLRLQR
jgi:hypothetical protein